MYADLQPYSCFFADCSFSAAPFQNCEDWATHLRLQHEIGPDWKRVQCPFCSEVIVEGKEATINHLSRHMEDIATAALPQDIDSGAESNSDTPLDQTTRSVADDNWQCTFCRVSLTAKSWRRHEETQHYPKYQWTCLYSGPKVQLPSSSQLICAFCEIPDPDDEHFQHHRISECLSKAEPERTFSRPDHLYQHAKNYHRCEQPLSDLVRDMWRKDGPSTVKNWTCGFCQEVLFTWDTRAAHIETHFRAGMWMAQWRDGNNFGAPSTSPVGREGAPIGETLYNVRASPRVEGSASSYHSQEVSGTASKSYECECGRVSAFVPSYLITKDGSISPFLM